MGFLAMTEKKTAMAGSAKIAEENIFVPQTGGKKLRTIGFRYVEANMFVRRLMPRRHHVQPLQRIGFFAGAEFIKIFRGIGELRSEFGYEFGAHFVATAVDRRAESCDEVGWLGAELHAHLPDGFLRDSGKCSAPAGVNGSDGALLWIDQQNRNAVGRLDAEQ